MKIDVTPEELLDLLMKGHPTLMGNVPPAQAQEAAAKMAALAYQPEKEPGKGR